MKFLYQNSLTCVQQTYLRHLVSGSWKERLWPNEVRLSWRWLAVVAVNVLRSHMVGDTGVRSHMVGDTGVCE